MSRIVVRSLKYDGRIHRTWEVALVEKRETLIVAVGSFPEEVRHPLLGNIRAGTLSTEYFWTDRWYSIFRFGSPSGALRNFYCNINTPVRYEASTLSYIDLDIDVLVAPDFSIRVLDEDEFETHSSLYGYAEEVRRGALDGLEEVLGLIKRKSFPFDENLSNHIDLSAP